MRNPALERSPARHLQPGALPHQAWAPRERFPPKRSSSQRETPLNRHSCGAGRRMRTGAAHGPQGVGGLGLPFVRRVHTKRARERRGAVSSQSILHPKRVLSLSHSRICPAGDSRGSKDNVGRKKDPSRDPPPSAQLDLDWAQQGLLGSPGGDLRDGPDWEPPQLWVGVPSSPAGLIMKPELILDRWGGVKQKGPLPPRFVRVGLRVLFYYYAVL